MNPARQWLLLTVLLATALCGAPKAHAQSIDPIEESRKAIKRADRLRKEGYLQAACRENARAMLIAPEWWYPVTATSACASTPSDSVQLLERAIKKEPNPYSLHLALARLLLQRGNFAGAAIHLAAALEQDKSNALLLWQLSEALLAQNKRASAMEILTRAIEAHPTATLFLVRFAKTAEALGRLPEAEWGYRNLAIHGVNPRRNLRVLADFYTRQGCQADAAWVNALWAQKRPLSQQFRPSETCVRFLGTH